MFQLLAEFIEIKSEDDADIQEQCKLFPFFVSIHLLVMSIATEKMLRKEPSDRAKPFDVRLSFLSNFYNHLDSCLGSLFEIRNGIDGELMIYESSP